MLIAMNDIFMRVLSRMVERVMVFYNTINLIDFISFVSKLLIQIRWL